jgi:excisionase family DNA binding protein
MNQRELLSVKDVAVRLDVHEQTVRTLIRDGRLSAVRVGKLVRVSTQALAEFYRVNRYADSRAL